MTFDVLLEIYYNQFNLLFQQSYIPLYSYFFKIQVKRNPYSLLISIYRIVILTFLEGYHCLFAYVFVMFKSVYI